MAVPIDFEAEGLLDGAEGDRARSARLELLRTLETEGFELEELRRATREDRLALLPLERVLEGEGRRYTREEVAEESGLDVGQLLEARRALGAAEVGPGERSLIGDDLALARQARLLLDSGLSWEAFLDISRTMSRAMAGVAASLMTNFGEALMRPGDTERDLGLRYAESVRKLGPLAGPALGHILNLRLREQTRQAVVGQAQLRSGRLPGAQPMVVGFVDIVGFTSLGEQVPTDELGAVIGRFERRVEDAVRTPVRLVKTIGDAAMLVAPAADPIVRTALELVEGSRNDGDTELRGGVAAGEALPRAGDWYGRPVNLASRLTAFARRGSVVTTGDVRAAAAGDYLWSFARRRRFKGVDGEVEVYRVRSSPV